MLRADAPGSLRAWAIMLSRSFHRQAWTGLEESLRTGVPAFERVHGQACFDHCRDQPEDGEILDAAMTAVSSQFIAPVVQQHEFPAAGTVVDVGGGRGGLIAAVLAANPHLRGVLYDLPHVVARQIVDQAGVGDREGQRVIASSIRVRSSAPAPPVSNTRCSCASAAWTSRAAVRSGLAPPRP